MFFKYKHEGAEPSRVPNVTCFSIIFVVSLTGAVGLATRATSGNGFCEEFLSDHPEKCREAGLTIAMSWISVIIGELMYLSQSTSSDFLVDSFSDRRDLGFLVG